MICEFHINTAIPNHTKQYVLLCKEYVTKCKSIMTSYCICLNIRKVSFSNFTNSMEQKILVAHVAKIFPSFYGMQ
jgi:hypothetical protein